MRNNWSITKRRWKNGRRIGETQHGCHLKTSLLSSRWQTLLLQETLNKLPKVTKLNSPAIDKLLGSIPQASVPWKGGSPGVQ